MLDVPFRSSGRRVFWLRSFFHNFSWSSLFFSRSAFKIHELLRQDNLPTQQFVQCEDESRIFLLGIPWEPLAPNDQTFKDKCDVTVAELLIAGKEVRAFFSYFLLWIDFFGESKHILKELR